MKKFLLSLDMIPKLRVAYISVCGILFRFIFSFVKTRNEQVIFQSFDGRFVCDSPLYLYREIRKREKMSFVWVIRHHGQKEHFKNDEKENIRFVIYRSLSYYLELSRSKVIVSNSRMPYFFSKSSSQTYLQCWHGTPLKRIGLDIKRDLTSRINLRAITLAYQNESRLVDYFLSPSQYASERFCSSFDLDRAKILELGYPRNDTLVTSVSTKYLIVDVKKKLGISSDSRVILYAPTYRDNSVDSSGNHISHNFLSSETFLSSLGENVVFLVRGHYFSKMISNSTKFIDVSEYNNINDLYLVADALITDYSSVFFDYAILNRRIYFYMPDLNEYENELRGFYLDVPSDLPGTVAFTEEELVASILKDDFSFSDNSAFNSIYNPLEDGMSAKRYIDFLVDKRVI